MNLLSTTQGSRAEAMICSNAISAREAELITKGTPKETAREIALEEARLEAGIEKVFKTFRTQK